MTGASRTAGCVCACVLAQVDNRGSARRGLAFEGAIKNWLGKIEVLRISYCAAPYGSLPAALPSALGIPCYVRMRGFSPPNRAQGSARNSANANGRPCHHRRTRAMHFECVSPLQVEDQTDGVRWLISQGPPARLPARPAPPAAGCRRALDPVGRSVRRWRRFRRADRWEAGGDLRLVVRRVPRGDGAHARARRLPLRRRRCGPAQCHAEQEGWVLAQMWAAALGL